MPGRRTVEMHRDDCGFSYRDSCFKHAAQGRWLILAVRFSLPKRWHPVLDYPDLKSHFQGPQAVRSVTPRQVFDAVCRVRSGKLPDPAVLGNAGSFFKNPVVSEAQFREIKAAWPCLVASPEADDRDTYAAGWMIARGGWNGRRRGSDGMPGSKALVMEYNTRAVACKGPDMNSLD